MSMRRVTVLSVFLLSAALPAAAQELVYTPVNPSFGGNSFNSSHLLAIAEIDRPDPPQDDTFGGFGLETSQADLFVRQLESRILSRLSSNITDAIFGPDAEPSGEFVFEDTSIAFDTLIDGTIVLNIEDRTTGGVTTIEVPSFLAGIGQ